MSEKKIQVQRFEASNEFVEISKERFQDRIGGKRSFDFITIEYEQVVYFKIAPSGRIVAKNDYGNGRCYMVKFR